MQSEVYFSQDAARKQRKRQMAELSHTYVQGKRKTWTTWIFMVTQAIQLSLDLLALLLSGWLGDSSPSWRHKPSITRVQKQTLRLLRLTVQTGDIVFSNAPVRPSTALSFSSSYSFCCVRHQQSDLVLLPSGLQKPEWHTWSGVFFCHPLPPPSLSPLHMAAIFIPLSSGRKYRSGSGPISISRGPQQQKWKANSEIQSPSWTPSWQQGLTDIGFGRAMTILIRW